MNDTGFRTYLEQDHASDAGKPLSPAAAGDYVSRCRRVEKLLGCDLDSDGPTAEAIAARIEAHPDTTNAAVLRDLQTAVRRYFEFRQSRRA